MVLTNGAQWNLYRVEFKQPVTTTKVLAVDFVEPSLDQESLLALHRWGMQRNVAGIRWQRQSALAPADLVKILLSEGVLKEVAGELRKATGYRIDVPELQERLIADVLKDGLVGQVSVADLGVPPTSGGSRRSPVAVNGGATAHDGAAENGAPVRRVRLSHLLAAGLLTPGDQLFAEWNGAHVTATVQDNGTLLGTDWTAANLDEAARAVTGGTAQRGWEFWKHATGDEMSTLRERFVANV